jgi:CheY-like chemotaxis protein
VLVKKNMTTQHSPLRVLVADDLPAHRHLLSAILESLQVQAHAVTDGAEAVAAAAHDFDLILLDINMPVMDGIQAVREIRRRERGRDGRRTPIFMVSSQSDPADLRASREAGADGHIAKPVSVACVLQAAHYAATRRRSAQAERGPAPFRQWLTSPAA